MNHEKTFAAIEKLKDVELELHRLKNALELANKALDAQPAQEPRLDQSPDYERGFVDGMMHLTQTSVYKAVNAIAQPAQEPVGEMQLSGIIDGLVIPVVPVELPVGAKLYTTPQPQEFVCSTDLCHFTLIQTNVGIGERGMEAYEAAKKRGWVGVSDERMMEMPKQEPVAMRYDYDGYGYKYIDNGSGSDWQTRIKDAEPVYTTPPQRPWVGLTDDEIWKDDGIMAANSKCGAIFETLREIVRAIEAKLKEKNT